MPICNNCNTEVEVGQAICPGCGAAVSTEETSANGEPVVVLQANTTEEAMAAEVALEAEGIPAYVNEPSMDAFADESAEVLVPAELADEAAAVLNEPPMSDEELNAAADAGATEQV